MTKPKKLKKPMNTELIATYVSKLTATLGKEVEFAEVFDELGNDPLVSQPMLVQICKSFYGEANSKTSRAEALRRIKLRQTSLLDFRAKSRAQSGKSAA